LGYSELLPWTMIYIPSLNPVTRQYPITYRLIQPNKIDAASPNASLHTISKVYRRSWGFCFSGFFFLLSIPSKRLREMCFSPWTPQTDYENAKRTNA
jgi:hypothetical protein